MKNKLDLFAAILNFLVLVQTARVYSSVYTQRSDSKKAPRSLNFLLLQRLGFKMYMCLKGQRVCGL